MILLQQFRIPSPALSRDELGVIVGHLSGQPVSPVEQEVRERVGGVRGERDLVHLRPHLHTHQRHENVHTREYLATERQNRVISGLCCLVDDTERDVKGSIHDNINTRMQRVLLAFQLVMTAINQYCREMTNCELILYRLDFSRLE